MIMSGSGFRQLLEMNERMIRLMGKKNLNNNTSLVMEDAVQAPVVGVGGRVWSPRPKRPLTFTDHVKTVVRALLSPSILLGTLTAALAVFAAITAGNSMIDHQIKFEQMKLASAFELEYGYSDVGLIEDGKIQVTVTETGETKKVSASTYMGAPVLYESEEQLEEKKAEADAGTYEVLEAIKAAD